MVAGFNFPIDEDSSPTPAAQAPQKDLPATPAAQVPPPASQEDVPTAAAAQVPPPATQNDIPTTQPAVRRTTAKNDVPAPTTQSAKRARTRNLPTIQLANTDAATTPSALGKQVRKPTGPREPIALTDRDSAAGGKGTAKRKLDERFTVTLRFLLF